MHILSFLTIPFHSRSVNKDEKKKNNLVNIVTSATTFKLLWLLKTQFQQIMNDFRKFLQIPVSNSLQLVHLVEDNQIHHLP